VFVQGFDLGLESDGLQGPTQEKEAERWSDTGEEEGF